MLSLGTELPLALAMASASVGLPAGSPPPVRAATSTFLMSFANSLPRRASTTAFLCFVVAHFEWPLTAATPSPSTRTGRAPGGLRSARGGTRSPATDPAVRRQPYPRLAHRGSQPRAEHPAPTTRPRARG